MVNCGLWWRVAIRPIIALKWDVMHLVCTRSAPRRSTRGRGRGSGRAKCDDPRGGLGPTVLSESAAIAQAETKQEGFDKLSDSLWKIGTARAASQSDAGRGLPKAKRVANLLLPKSEWTHFGFRK